MRSKPPPPSSSVPPERDGRDALSYAERRGLTPDTLKLFRIGYAPGTKDALKGALLKRGFTESQLTRGRPLGEAR